ncbi:MAG: hypothetical protein WB714_32235 [Candidatus Sulfotelmatobacter sp.]
MNFKYIGMDIHKETISIAGAGHFNAERCRPSLPALYLDWPSRFVMEKCEFVFVGEGPIDDGMRTIRYPISSASQQAG